MDTQSPTDLPLPRAIFYQVVHDLTQSLRTLTDETPEAIAQRNHAAVAHVTALRPANLDEAHLATQYVACCAHALDNLRFSHVYPKDEVNYLRCTAQAASMMRNARSWRTLLERKQAERRKLEANPTADDAADQSHQHTLGQLTDALADIEADPPPPQSEPPDPIAEAERYAISHRKRASLIRTLGHLPDRLGVGYLQPAVVQAIITGTSPILRALGKKSLTPADLLA